MTLSIEFGNIRKDKSVAVYIRVEHRGTRFRVNTQINLNKSEYYYGKTGYKIRNITKHSAIEGKVNKLRNKIIEEYGEYLVTNNELDLSRLFLPKQKQSPRIPRGDKLKIKMDNLMLAVDATDNQNDFHDFYEFFDGWYERCTAKGKKNYQTGMKKFKAFVDKDSLSFSEITPQLLSDFQDSLSDLPRAQSMYMANLHHIWKEAEKWYDDDLPKDPFKKIKIVKQKAVGQRAVDTDTIIKVYEYKPQFSTDELARDCYLLSFCFMGMNSADLYTCAPIKNGVLAYNRTKVKDRRDDGAHTEINVPDFIMPLVLKYMEQGTGKKASQHAFNFFRRYRCFEDFNRALNMGLKKIFGKGSPISFYSARHTWATIARNDLGIDKGTINDALVHIDKDMAVTDLYIKKDYRLINEANKKVIDFVFGKYMNKSEEESPITE